MGIICFTSTDKKPLLDVLGSLINWEEGRKEDDPQGFEDAFHDIINRAKAEEFESICQEIEARKLAEEIQKAIGEKVGILVGLQSAISQHNKEGQHNKEIESFNNSVNIPFAQFIAQYKAGNKEEFEPRPLPLMAEENDQYESAQAKGESSDPKFNKKHAEHSRSHSNINHSTFFTPKREFITGGTVNIAAAGIALGAIAFMLSPLPVPALLATTAVTFAGLSLSTGGLALAIGLGVLGAIGIGLMYSSGELV